MTLRSMPLSLVVLCFAAAASAQQVPPQAPSIAYQPGINMNDDIARIAVSVQSMTKTLKDFVDKFAKVEGISISERQARMVVGMQLLVQAEQRAAGFQKQQFELVEKESQLRTRLTQIDIDIDQQSLDRSVAFEGGTRTPEIKETRRRALQAERASVQSVLQQLQATLQDVGYSLREAQTLVGRLRRTFLPQVERELADQ